MGKIIDILERFGIIASDAQAEDFEKWMVNFTWSKYNEDKMNQRIIILLLFVHQTEKLVCALSIFQQAKSI